jgi:cell division protein FtsB
MPEPKPKPKATAKAKAATAKRSPRPRGRHSTLVLLLVGLALVAVLFAFVYPTRTYLHQRRELNAAERQLAVLHDTTKALEHDSAKLQSDAEVERRAREDYGLVRPGETPYVLVPSPPTTWVP